MTNKMLWIITGCLVILSLLTVSCRTPEHSANITSLEDSEAVIITNNEVSIPQEEVETIVSSEGPYYGGTIKLALNAEPVWDLFSTRISAPQLLAHQRLFDGDWSKGLAGGYGQGLTDWGETTNIPSLNTGYLATEMQWEISGDGTEITTTFIMRDNVYFADIDGEAGDLINGREMTIDDIVWNWNQRLHNEKAQYYQLYPSCRYPEAVKTSNNSFTITHTFDDYLSAIVRENYSAVIFPSELWDNFGYEACTNWRYSVGTGPFIVTDYVAGIMVELERNPDYWMIDPTGPGKGNQLPYADKVNFIIMTDEATRQAAIRTGSIDMIGNIDLQIKNSLLDSRPDLLAAARGSRSENPLFMRTDLDLFSDIRIRKALMMAIDFQKINNDLYGGLGQIISWPYYDVDGYDLLSVTLDDPDLPGEVWELYSHDIDKAKTLLRETSYPYGFKATAIVQQSDISYYSIIADMWAEIGVDLEIKPVEFGKLISTASLASYDDMIVLNTAPDYSFPEQAHYAERNWLNASLIYDTYIDETAERIRTLAVTDFSSAMRECRPLVMYLLEQAYVIPAPRYPVYTLWWPWLQNYSGETSVGYFSGDSWTQWVWVDQSLKAKMGY